MNKDLKSLLKALEAQGFDVARTRKGHWMVRCDGRLVSTISGSASDPRSLRNAIAEARRHGFQWRK